MSKKKREPRLYTAYNHYYTPVAKQSDYALASEESN